MKRYFDLFLNNKKQYTLKISGYSKIYNWLFRNVIRLKHTISASAPNLITRLGFGQVLRITQSLTPYSPLLKQRFPFDIVNKLQYSLSNSVFNLKSRLYGTLSISPSIHINNLLVKYQLNSESEILVRLKHQVTISMAQFYKLAEWDYKNPSDTTTKYIVSELDNLTLEEMDIKAVIS